jgi:transposase
MRLCYSRRLFVRAFPTQKQEAFFEGHVQAFHFFGGYMRNRQVLDPQLDCHEPNCLLAFGLHNNHFTHPLG